MSGCTLTGCTDKAPLSVAVSSSNMDDSEADDRVGLMSKNLIPSMWEIMAQYSGSTDTAAFLLNRTLNASDLFTNATTANATAISTTTTTTTTTTVPHTNTTVMPLVNDTECSPNSTFMLALPWVRITIGLLMVMENSLSLLALWRVKRMQTAVHRFISSLAVAELLMGVWCCYRYSAEILMGSDHVTFECRLRFVGMTYLNFAAILSVCSLCLDRCIALHFPFRYVELVTKTRIRVVLGAIWCLPLAFVLTAYVETDASCEACSFVHIASQRTYIVLTVLRCVLITLIIVSELLIFRSARCQIIKIYPSVFSSRNSNRFLRMNAKAAITTLAVVVPFLLLYFPVLLVQGNLAVRPEMADSCQSQLLAFVWLFASAHGLFTPIIFCWRFTEVRQNLFRLLCCWTEPPAPAGVFQLRTNDSALTL